MDNPFALNTDEALRLRCVELAVEGKLGENAYRINEAAAKLLEHIKPTPKRDPWPRPIAICYSEGDKYLTIYYAEVEHAAQNAQVWSGLEGIPLNPDPVPQSQAQAAERSSA